MIIRDVSVSNKYYRPQCQIPRFSALVSIVTVIFFDLIGRQNIVGIYIFLNSGKNSRMRIGKMTKI